MPVPVVSIVVPAYNAEATIGEMIESVLAQSYCDYELVICDDASEDGTVQTIESYSDDRIRLIRDRCNQGEGRARDQAIYETKGKWVAVLDADDAYHSQRLERLIQAAGNEADRMVFDDIMECHHGPSGLVPWRRVRGARAYGALRRPVDVPAFEWIGSSRLLIKPLIPGAALRNCGVLHSNRRFGADTEFFLNLLARGLKLRYLPEAYYHYRLSPGSMSSIRSRSIQLEEVLSNAMIMFADDPGMVGALRRRFKLERRNEMYFQFMWSLKDRHLSEAIGKATSHPWVVAECLCRIAHEAPYHAHRLWHHGSGRTPR